LADIGGTNARFALQHRGQKPHHIIVLQSREYRSLRSALAAYLKRAKPASRPRYGALAVASPIQGDEVRLTNSPWSFSISQLRDVAQLERLEVVNDFAAAALSVPKLSTPDRRKIGRGKRRDGAPVAVLGPGTGLGVAVLVHTEAGPVALETEGGHVTLPPFDDFEAGVLGFLRLRFGHVSAERVLSGPGLVNLFRALAPIEGQPVERVSPATVTRRALSGTCPTSKAVVDMFCNMLGTVASNLALSVGAHGGVYIAGGIVPKLGDAFDASRFRARFEAKGRFSSYLAAIPTYVITHPLPAFLGLAHLLDTRVPMT
jgi:glucokinase